MQKKVINFLNLAMATIIGIFIGYSLFFYQSYHNHPDWYMAQSAPWYLNLIWYGAVTLLILLALIAIKAAIRKKQKKLREFI